MPLPVRGQSTLLLVAVLGSPAAVVRGSHLWDLGTALSPSAILCRCLLAADARLSQQPLGQGRLWHCGLEVAGQPSANCQGPCHHAEVGRHTTWRKPRTYEQHSRCLCGLPAAKQRMHGSCQHDATNLAPHASCTNHVRRRSKRMWLFSTGAHIL